MLFAERNYTNGKLDNQIYETAKAKPDQVITLPITKINIGKQLLPVNEK